MVTVGAPAAGAVAVVTVRALLAAIAAAEARHTWTPFPPCESFLVAAKARGNPVELKSYPQAVHAFDAPNLPRRELPQYRTGDGPIPVIATDRAARFDAFVRVLEFLKSHLETN